MAVEKPEKRGYGRFFIPGATIRAKRKKALFRKEGFGRERSPLLDLSRGGVRFLTSSKLPLDASVTLEITVPGVEAPIVLLGHVRWFSRQPDAAFRYQFGVQLAPYGDKEGENPPEILDRIIALEKARTGRGEETEVPT